jgi:hypothetical protein
MIEQKDLLLVPFPFSDQSGRKVRPVIVISNDEFNKYSDDILVIGVTSNISKDKYAINLTNNKIMALYAADGSDVWHSQIWTGIGWETEKTTSHLTYESWRSSAVGYNDDVYHHDNHEETRYKIKERSSAR